MRRKDPLQTRLYQALFPFPQRETPRTWGTFVREHLVPEVRLEIHTFYGEHVSDEARHPGLDYSYPPHRRRLCRFDNHRLLFEALDKLDLTVNETRELCSWEGTWVAQKRFERERGVRVVDTTGWECVPAVRESMRREADEKRRRHARAREVTRAGARAEEDSNGEAGSDMAMEMEATATAATAAAVGTAWGTTGGAVAEVAASPAPSSLPATTGMFSATLFTIRAS